MWNNTLSSLPTGVQEFAGVRFDVRVAIDSQALFHDTEDGRLLKEQFDQGMERAAKKGELAQYFINLDDFVFAQKIIHFLCICVCV